MLQRTSVRSRFATSRSGRLSGSERFSHVEGICDF